MLVHGQTHPCRWPLHDYLSQLDDYLKTEDILDCAFTLNSMYRKRIIFINYIQYCSMYKIQLMVHELCDLVNKYIDR